MINKILKILIPFILIGIIISIGYNAYIKTQKNEINPIEVIPNNASIIIQLNNVKNLSRYLKKSTIWSKLKSIDIIDSISNNADDLNRIFIENPEIFKSNKLFISLHKVSLSSSALLLCTSIETNKQQNIDTIINLFATDFKSSLYDNQNVYHSEKLNKYLSFKNGILFVSNNKMIIEDAIRTSQEDTDNLFVNKSFINSYKTINNTSDINLMINYNNLISFSNTLISNKFNTTNFSEWASSDVKIKDHTILANGLSSHSKKINNFLDIFNNQKSEDLNILNIIPESTSQLFAISFDNQKEIFNNKNALLQKNNSFWNWNKDRKIFEDKFKFSYSDLIHELGSEAGVFNTSINLEKDNYYTFLNTKEPIKAVSLLQVLIESTNEYKEFFIHKINEPKLVANLFGNIFDYNKSFFTIFEEYLIFGESNESLEYIIDNYKSRNTIALNNTFKNVSTYLSEDANIFMYLNPSKTAKVLQKNLINSKSIKIDLDSISKFTGLSLQINNTNNGMIHNIVLFYDKDYKETLKEQWYFYSDTTISFKPFFIKNHFTNQKMILFQDNSNKLFALNATGEEQWNIQLNQKILGEINFIDFYNNKKFQALFNTDSQLYLVDRNGDLVDGFPIKLPDKTKYGHSIFDYNKNKKYRIIIVGNNNQIYNLNKKGREVRGWKFVKTNDTIKQSPIHFTLNGNDYILHATNNTKTTKLIARNGTDRVIFKDLFKFNSEVKITDSGNLYSLTSDNKIWIGNVNGNSKLIEDALLNENSKIISFKDGFYASNQNTLRYLESNNTNDLSIVFEGLIKHVSIYDEYLFVVTENKLYILKDNNIIDGFPIDSDGLFNISDKNNKLNIVNIKNGFIYNYELID